MTKQELKDYISRQRKIGRIYWKKGVRYREITATVGNIDELVGPNAK